MNLYNQQLTKYDKYNSFSSYNELYIFMIHKNILRFNDIPIDMLSNEICELGIKYQGFVIKYIPEYMLTYKMCYMAVNQSGVNIKYVPRNLKTQSLCLLAINHVDSIMYISEEIFDNIDDYINICSRSVEENSESIKYIPEDIITENMCNIAMKNNSLLIRYIPKILLTKEMCILSVINNNFNYNISYE
jgi:hypothetical protein